MNIKAASHGFRLGARGGVRAFALVVALVSGCASPLRPMPHDVLTQLKPGMTTMAEAEAALGAPDDTAALPDGSEEWLYHFAAEPALATPDLPAPTDPLRRPDVLRLVFSPAGVLVNAEATRSMLGVRDAAHPPEPDHEALQEIPIE